MPERGFDTGFWTEDFVMGLTHPAKLLFHYVGSNDHCNQAGVYHIAPRTISFETGLPESDLASLFNTLSPEVRWLPAENIVWVKNFIAHQAKSPKFLIAAAKCLKKIRNNGLVAEVLEYNRTYHTLSIPYEYSTDSISIPPVSVSVSDTVTGEGNEVQGQGKPSESTTGEVIPRSRLEDEETLCEGDREVISVWRSVKGFAITLSDASALVASLRKEFPDVDILEVSKVWAAGKLDDPLQPGSRPSRQLWNFMRMERKFAARRKDTGQKGMRRVEGTRKAEEFRGGVVMEHIGDVLAGREPSLTQVRREREELRQKGLERAAADFDFGPGPGLVAYIRDMQRRQQEDDSAYVTALLWQLAGIDADPDQVFDKFKVKKQYPTLQEALQAARDWAHYKGKPFLTLAGPAGVGKTFLAIAAAQEIVATGGMVIYRRVVDLLKELREDNFERHRSDVDTDLRLVPFLIIDDLGLQKSSEWSLESVDDLVDFRYSTKRRLMVCTMGKSEDLPPRIADRLADIAVGRVVQIEAISFRRTRGK